MVIARDSGLVIAAESMKNMFDEYVKVGFTEPQALELCKAMIGRMVLK